MTTRGRVRVRGRGNTTFLYKFTNKRVTVAFAQLDRNYRQLAHAHAHAHEVRTPKHGGAKIDCGSAVERPAVALRIRHFQGCVLHLKFE